jgi:Au+-exporting ATPase
VGRVERALGKVEGVESVSVNLATERAEIKTRGTVDGARLVAAVQSAGYDVPATEIELAVEGMTCASCVGRVEKALRAVAGVSEATCSASAPLAQIWGCG